jgi:aryl-alcohol dehydrogenase-like predicted oxidoreductase
MLGQFLLGRRENVVLLTKYTRTTERTAASARTGNHRKAMLQSIHASLKRLRTDCIDFYFAHADDGVTPVEEIMRGFDDLVHQGKILFGGLSNFSAWRTAQAATLAGAKNWAPCAGWRWNTASCSVLPKLCTEFSFIEDSSDGFCPHRFC